MHFVYYNLYINESELLKELEGDWSDIVGCWKKNENLILHSLIFDECISSIGICILSEGEFFKELEGGWSDNVGCWKEERKCHNLSINKSCIGWPQQIMY